MVRSFGSVCGQLALAALTVLGLLPAAGCVTGRAVRPSQVEAARGPTAAPVTGAPVVAQTAPSDGEDDAPARAKPGALWVRGYWHWDGVRYVWQRARWESPASSAP